MTRSRHALLALSVLLITTAFGACSSDDEGRTETTVTPTAHIVAEGTLRGAIETAATLDDTRTVIIVVAERARMGDVPTAVSGGVDLDVRRTGDEGELGVDIDGDGASEDVWVFLDDVNDLTFLAWDAEGVCNLAFATSADESWHLQVPCGGATEALALLSCSRDAGSGEAACQECSDGECEACETAGDDVFCAEPEPEPGPEPVLEVAPDAGGEDNGVEDNGGRDNGGDDADPGLCSAECMSQSLAECCTSCGCTSSVICRPLCPSGSLWDCETACCRGEAGCVE